MKVEAKRSEVFVTQEGTPQKNQPPNPRKDFKAEFEKDVKTLNDKISTATSTSVGRKISDALTMYSISRLGNSVLAQKEHPTSTDIDQSQTSIKNSIATQQTFTPLKESDSSTAKERRSRSAAGSGQRRTMRGFFTYKSDRFGRAGYLNRVGVMNIPRTGRMKRTKTLKNVKYNAGEIARQFRKSTSSLRMRIESDIRNYNPASNNSLKKQVLSIRSFDNPFV